MKLIFALIFLFLINLTNGFCIHKIDSLITVSSTQTGNEHLNSYLQIAEDFSYGNNGDTIIYYAEKCYREAKVLKDSIALLKSCLYWGSGLYSSKQYKKSLQKVETLFNLSKKLNYPKGKLQGYYLKARNYQGLKQYNEAIQSFQNGYRYSLSLFTTADKSFAGKSFNAFLKQLTYTYWYAAKVKEGIDYLHKSLEENSYLGELHLRAYYTNLAFLYNRGIDFKKAETFQLKAAEISNQSKNEDHIYMDQAYLGALYSNLGEYTKSIKHFEKALDIAIKQNSDNKISYISQNLGLCYDANGNLQKGVDMIFDGIKRHIENGDQKATAKAYQHLGRLMIKWHNFKEADNYLHKALNLHRDQNLPFLETIDYLNLAISKIQQQDRDSSEHYLAILKEQSESNKVLSAQCSYYLNKSILQLRFDNQPKEALLNIKTAQSLSNKCNSTALNIYVHQMLGEYYLKINSLLLAKDHLIKAWNKHNILVMLQDKSDIANALSKTYRRLHQPDSAYHYLQKTDSLNKKIHLREDVLMLYKKDNELTVQLAIQEKEALTKANKILFNRILLIRIFYITLLLALISLLIVYMRKRTKRLKTEIYTKDSEQIKLKKQSEIDKSSLKKTQQLINKQENTISELKEKLLQPEFNIKLEEDFNELEALLNSKLTTEEDWDKYLHFFTKKNPYFIPELKNRYPELSRNEIKIFVLVKLGLATREMAGILMISPSSVNTARYRLRKKINLDSSVKLEDTINEIEKAGQNIKH